MGRQLADSSEAKRYFRLIFGFTFICVCCLFYGQSVFAGITGAEIYAVFILRIQTKGGFAALFETAAILPFILTVGGENSAAAIKNARAFAPVAYSDFVIACDQAFGVILFSLQIYLFRNDLYKPSRKVQSPCGNRRHR